MYRIVHFRKIAKFQIITKIFKYLSLCLCLYLRIYICLLYLKYFRVYWSPGAPFPYICLYFFKSRKFLLHYNSNLIKIMILTVKCYCHLICRSYSDFTNCLINGFYSKRKESGSGSYITCHVSFSLSGTFP